MKRQIVLAMLSTALFGWSCPGYAQTSWTVRPVAVIGDATPGGGTFAKFEDRPNINEAGDVVFVATIAGGKAPRGIFLASKGTLTQIVAVGDSPPDGGTFETFRLGRSAPMKSGAALFLATLTGGKAHKGIFRASKETITKVVVEGDSITGIGTFSHILDDRPSGSDDGSVSFIAEVLTATPQEGSSRTSQKGIFIAAQGRFTKVVGLGDPTPLGGAFHDFGRPAINERGALVFSASIKGGSTPGALFHVAGEKITPVLRVGDRSPDGGAFKEFEGVWINSRGDISFRAFMEGGKSAIESYVVSHGSVAKIAAAEAPLPDGRVFDLAFGRPMMNDRGEMAFKAKLHGGQRGAGKEGIFAIAGEAITKVVVDVDSTPVGGTFGILTPPFLSDAGAIAFRASVIGGRTSEGIFVATQP
jgi:hypothetical protein